MMLVCSAFYYMDQKIIVSHNADDRIKSTDPLPILRKYKAKGDQVVLALILVALAIQL